MVEMSSPNALRQNLLQERKMNFGTTSHIQTHKE